jgi:hypothetical protein
MPTGIGTALLISGLASAGGAVAGGAIASHGNTEAAKTQAQATQAGIDELKREYDLQRSDLAPYRGVGAGAVGNLAYLGGITMPSSTTPQIGTPTNPLQTTPASLGTLGVPSGSLFAANASQPAVNAYNQLQQRAATGQMGPTTHVSKNGQTILLPTSLLPQALQSGWVQVQ